MHFIKPLIARARGFRGDDKASLSVEAVVILPFLLWAFLATFTYFDIYRSKTLSLKANYAVSDLVSRETALIDQNYLLGLEDVFQYLTRGGDPAWLRVTVLSCRSFCDDPSARELKRFWSKATDGLDTHSNTDLAKYYNNLIPLMAKDDYLIMVETGVGYEPPFNVRLTGIKPRMMQDIVMTRPRFGIPQWDHS